VFLGVIKLYVIDYGGESDWVAAYSEDEAREMWLNSREEFDEAADDFGIMQDHYLDDDGEARPIAGDAPKGTTMQSAMSEKWPPCFVATSIY
jgi:hypothetical protein